MDNSGFTLQECETAEELWEALSPLKPLKPVSFEFIYRGQSDAGWSLQPTVSRNTNPASRMFRSRTPNADDQIFAELVILESFAKECDSLSLRIPGDSRKFRETHLDYSRADKFYKNPSMWPDEELIELMALAQHHGVPTRLLDWTRRSFVAVYFAAADALRKSNDWKTDDKLAVWALDISTIRVHTSISIVHVSGSTSINLAAQAGVFTLLREKGTRTSPFENKCLEDELKTCGIPTLWKFTLPVTQSLRILELCRLYGITAATLFPGYDGAAKAVGDFINTWGRLNPTS